jgi:hypothetical protein
MIQQNQIIRRWTPPPWEQPYHLISKFTERGDTGDWLPGLMIVNAPPVYGEAGCHKCNCLASSRV